MWCYQPRTGLVLEVGKSTTKTIIEGLTKEYEKGASIKIREEFKNDKKKILVVFDNYNILHRLQQLKLTRHLR